MFASGHIVKREYQLSGFTAIEASRFDLEVVQSDEFAVVVYADDDLIDRLVVRASGDTLILRPGRFSWLIGRHALEATVSLPTLDDLTLLDSASAQLIGFRGVGRIALTLSGASELRGDIEAAAVNFLCSGACRVRLAGSAASIRVEASGASKLDLAEMRVDSAGIELSGASRASVNAATIETITASGASTLRYNGDPTFGHIETSGASRMVRV